MPRRTRTILGTLMLPVLLTACAVAPDRQDAAEFNATTATLMERLTAENPTIAAYAANAYGYAIFPVVGEGGLLIATGWGRGAVYEEGSLIGYARVSEHSIGAVAGGEKWTLLIFFQNAAALDEFKAGKFAFDAKANAVAGEDGAAVGTDYSNGVAVVRVDPAGLMGNASAGFSSYTYLSVDEARAKWNDQD